MIDLEHCRAEKQDHKTGKQDDMRPTGYASSTDTLLAKAFCEQPRQSWSELEPDLSETASDQLPHADWETLFPKPKPPPNAIKENDDR